MQEQHYIADSRPGGRGRLFVPVPFDPDRVWTPKPVHHVTGTLNGMSIRAVIVEHEGQRGFLLGPAWLRCGLQPGTRVSVLLTHPRRAAAGRSRRGRRRRTGGQHGGGRLLRLPRPVLPAGLPALDRCHQRPARGTGAADRRGGRPAGGGHQAAPRDLSAASRWDLGAPHRAVSPYGLSVPELARHPTPFIVW